MTKIKNAKFCLFLAAITLTGLMACKKDKQDTAPAQKVETVNMSITDLKAKSTSAAVTLTETGKLFKVKGIVISDKIGKNIDAKTAVIAQADNAAGIIVNFTAAHNLSLGDEVELGVSNQKLVQQNGEIILDGIPVDSAKTTATGKTVTPKQTTIADIISNKAAWDGTLVALGEGMFTGTGKYHGTLTYTIGTASIQSEIAGGAAFENTDYPGLTTGLTGIVRATKDGVLLNIRNTADVKKPETFVYVEDFSGAKTGIYTGLRTIAADAEIYDKLITTTLTNTYPNSPIFGTGWVRNYRKGATAINRIKTITPGSNDPDASFTTAKNYYCALPTSTPFVFSDFSDPNGRFAAWEYFCTSIGLFRGAGEDDNLKGLKSITVVCAGSKMKIADFDPEGAVSKDATMTGFDPGKDGFAVNFGTNVGENLYAVNFKDQGVWQTVKFDNIADKLAALDKDGKGRRDLYITFSSAPNQRGTLFTNLNGEWELVVGTPVIIDKIIFEFTEKPFWAK
jgi:hypothetical protein